MSSPDTAPFRRGMLLIGITAVIAALPMIATATAAAAAGQVTVTFDYNCATYGFDVTNGDSVPHTVTMTVGTTAGDPVVVDPGKTEHLALATSTEPTTEVTVTDDGDGQHDGHDQGEYQLHAAGRDRSGRGPARPAARHGRARRRVHGLAALHTEPVLLRYRFLRLARRHRRRQGCRHGARAARVLQRDGAPKLDQLCRTLGRLHRDESVCAAGPNRGRRPERAERHPQVHGAGAHHPSHLARRPRPDPSA